MLAAAMTTHAERERRMIDLDLKPSQATRCHAIYGHVCVGTKGKRLACVCVFTSVDEGRKALEVCHLITSTSVNPANMFLAVSPNTFFSSLFIQRCKPEGLFSLFSHFCSHCCSFQPLTEGCMVHFYADDRSQMWLTSASVLDHLSSLSLCLTHYSE